MARSPIQHTKQGNKKRGVGKIGGFISKGIRKPVPTMFLNNLKDLVLSPEAAPGFFCDTI